MCKWLAMEAPSGVFVGVDPPIFHDFAAPPSFDAVDEIKNHIFGPESLLHLWQTSAVRPARRGAREGQVNGRPPISVTEYTVLAGYQYQLLPDFHMSGQKQFLSRRAEAVFFARLGLVVLVNGRGVPYQLPNTFGPRKQYQTSEESGQ